MPEAFLNFILDALGDLCASGAHRVGRGLKRGDLFNRTRALERRPKDIHRLLQTASKRHWKSVVFNFSTMSLADEGYGVAVGEELDRSFRISIKSGPHLLFACISSRNRPSDPRSAWAAELVNSDGKACFARETSPTIFCKARASTLRCL